jgi:hypothetical protein
MRRLIPWLLAVLVLGGAFLALAGVGLVAFWFGPFMALAAVFGGVGVVWAVRDALAAARRVELRRGRPPHPGECHR